MYIGLEIEKKLISYKVHMPTGFLLYPFPHLYFARALIKRVNYFFLISKPIYTFFVRYSVLKVNIMLTYSLIQLVDQPKTKSILYYSVFSSVFLGLIQIPNIYSTKPNINLFKISKTLKKK